MILVETAGEGALLEVTMGGHVTRADYEEAMIPAVEKALADHDRLRMLIVVDENLDGFDLGAAWADTQLGLTHWGGFERIAVATGPGWIAAAARLMAPLLLCPVQIFALEEREDARRWLRESLGSVHMAPLASGALHVQLMGRLDPDAIARAEEGLDAHIRSIAHFRLLLDLTGFDGWQGLGAVAAHFKLVRDHAPLAERVAVLGDRTWQKAAERLAGRFLNADTRFFEPAARAQAESWLSG